jgi:N-acetylmuramoyl-L-alanine amidase
MKNIAVVVGHTSLSQGASGINIPSEFKFNSSVARYLSDIADIYNYSSYNLGYKTMVKNNANLMNKKDYDLVIELHYNAATPQANGTEVFYYFSNKAGKANAEFFSKKISQVFKTKDRGAKPMIDASQRGFWALFYPKATSILVEPFFGSNSYDADKFRDQECEYAELIRKILKELKYI